MILKWCLQYDTRSKGKIFIHIESRYLLKDAEVSLKVYMKAVCYSLQLAAELKIGNRIITCSSHDVLKLNLYGRSHVHPLICVLFPELLNGSRLFILFGIYTKTHDARLIVVLSFSAQFILWTCTLSRTCWHKQLIQNISRTIETILGTANIQYKKNNFCLCIVNFTVSVTLQRQFLSAINKRQG
jgi:hypothetical protein